MFPSAVGEAALPAGSSGLSISVIEMNSIFGDFPDSGDSILMETTRISPDS